MKPRAAPPDAQYSHRGFVVTASLLDGKTLEIRFVSSGGPEVTAALKHGTVSGCDNTEVRIDPVPDLRDEASREPLQLERECARERTGLVGRDADARARIAEVLALRLKSAAACVADGHERLARACVLADVGVTPTVHTEMRSAAACNGLLGDLEGRDCFESGEGWYSSRFVDADFQVFGDTAPYDKTEWHHVRTYWRLNDVEGGIGIANGVIRYWVDDELVIERDEVLMRTGAHPDMAFDQFLVAPYIGDGSPVDQTMWVDDLEVSIGVP